MKEEHSMKAIAIEAYGGPERLQMMDLPIPEVGPDDVLIRIRAAGVNPADINFREGYMAALMPLTFPATMGSDFAGTVAQVGTNVTTIQADAPVFGIVYGGGTYTEYLRLAATDEFVTIPAALDFVHAAALPMAGMTALGALDAAALAPGQTLLIVGGAGGIGTYAIQMAARQGAQVIVTARAADQEYVRGLGAAEVVDHTRDDVATAVLAAHPDGVDAVLDVASTTPDAIARIARVLRPGGHLLTTRYVIAGAPFGPEGPLAAELAERGISAANLTRPSGAAVLGRLSRLVEAGTLTVPVAETLPLEEAVRAQEVQEHGHVHGKVVLRVA
jgi:NADPH:quinone reductase